MRTYTEIANELKALRSEWYEAERSFKYRAHELETELRNVQGWTYLYHVRGRKPGKDTCVTVGQKDRLHDALTIAAEWLDKNYPNNWTIGGIGQFVTRDSEGGSPVILFIEEELTHPDKTGWVLTKEGQE